jgi:hypothetical protein
VLSCNKFFGVCKGLVHEAKPEYFKAIVNSASNVIDMLGSYHAIEVRKEGEWI